MLCGSCPMQGEGTIDGDEFYFRARGEHWTIGVGGDPVMKPNWFKEEPWGDGPFAAGWMSEEEARRIIEECAVEYMRFKYPKPPTHA